ncbi:hypothetical protein BURPSPAST_C1291 [Burkholderia pseudomallei Pasteur 52237]|nr:hypothetical protein BURPSPAST_C1291 [Burkholderia pseudomallei Pasteur 52237]
MNGSIVNQRRIARARPPSSPPPSAPAFRSATPACRAAFALAA